MDNKLPTLEVRQAENWSGINNGFGGKGGGEILRSN